MIDLVHDVQKSYRSLVSAMASPGRIVDLSQEAAKLADHTEVAPMVLLLGLVVLDAEVQFSIYAEDAATTPGGSVSHNLSQALSRITGSPAVDPDSPAPYVFVLGETTSCSFAFSVAPVGTLANPQLGATIFLEVAGFDGTATSLELAGPGIPDRRRLMVGRSPEWVGLRKEKNREYPLGVDLLLFDKRGRVVALPRTTQIRLVNGEI